MYNHQYGISVVKISEDLGPEILDVMIIGAYENGSTDTVDKRALWGSADNYFPLPIHLEIPSLQWKLSKISNI